MAGRVACDVMVEYVVEVEVVVEVVVEVGLKEVDVTELVAFQNG
jgi:hypothetical protein